MYYRVRKNKMDISVVVPTRGRESSLNSTLRALERQSLDHSQFEVIVVDNSPRGDGRERIENFSTKSGFNIRYFNEPVPGKSRAMKRGIREARGEFIAATDDDCIPREDWLEIVLNDFRAEPEDVYSIVGKVLPFDGETEMYTAVGEERGRRITYQSWPARARVGTIGNGSNAVYRRRAFEEFGDFLFFLGPGSPFHSGEEAEFFYRLLKGGKKIVFLPDSVVFHDPFRPISENHLREQETHHALGAMYAHHIGRGDLFLTFLLPVRLVGISLLSILLHLRRLILPSSKFHFSFRPACIRSFFLGFVRYFKKQNDCRQND